MNRYYEARAPWHDEYMGYESREGMEELLKPIIDTLAATIIGKRVIEIACGTGNWTQILAKRADSVVAIDVSPTALEIAQQKLVTYSNVSLTQCDAYDLRNIDGCFDVSFAADWWSHIPMGVLPQFVESVISKIGPGSKAVFVDMSFRDDFKQEPCSFDSDNNRITRRKLPDGSEFEVIKNFPDKVEIQRILSAYAKRVDHYKFDALHRWMVVLTPK
jgi:demethylmenaquinone methyltransferase/2-methoxy-6-polyprenyl-1,4-benzoquinol methylase